VIKRLVNHISTIFKGFDSDIDSLIYKIGVFGKSFGEIIDKFNNREAEIKSLIDPTAGKGLSKKEAKIQVGSVWSYLTKDKKKDALVEEFETFKSMMSDYGMSAEEVAKDLGDQLNPQIQSYVKIANNGKLTTEGFNRSIGNLSLGAKAASVATKGLTLAGNVLVSFLISQAIEGCIKLYRLSKDVAASANEVGSAFLSEKGSIESYKKQIAELYDTINDSSSSFEDVTNAREKLMDVQNELIDNFGTERSTIEYVTDAINGQVNALDKLSASKWQESENDFNKGGFWNTVGNFFAGYKNNIARMEKEYGNYSANLSFGSILGSDKRSEAANLLKAYGVSFNDAGLGMIKLSGNATEVYNQLISIQSLIKDVGADFGDSFNNELTSYINNAKDMSDQYEDFYNQYVLYNKVLSNGSQYSDAYKRIIDAKKSYDEAIKSGDKSSQNAAAQEYASAITEGSKLALENNESDVSNYFKSMYPELKQIVSEWTFELDFKVDKEGLKDDLKNYLNAFEGFSTEDLLKFNPAGGTDAQKLSYANMEKLADDYGMTFSELVKELENEKLIFSEAYHNLSNIFGEENISSLPEEDFTYALKIDVSEANKTLDAEEKRIATKIKQMSNLGNVDLTISPHVDENDMKNAGWDSNVADTSFGGKFVKQKDESGNDEYVYIHYTPVLPDGTILSPEQMSEYIQNTLNGSQNILDADDKGLVVKVDTEVPSSEDIEDFIDTGKMSDSMRLFLLQMNNWDVSCKKVRDDYSGINTACGYVNTTLQNMIAKQKSAEEFVPSTKQQMIENIDSLSEGFEELDKIMASMKDENPFDYSLLDDKKFKEAFSGCGEAYTDFIEKISSTPNDVSACQSAFNNLVTEWINSSGVMDGLSEDTAQLTEDMLTNMGITNAHEVVTALLAQKQFELGAANEYAAATGGDLASATDAEIAAYGAELAVQGQLTQQTAQFLLQKIKNNGITINTAADIDNIYALAQAAGATAGTLDALTAAKNRFGTNSSGSSYTDRLRARKDAFFAFKYGDKNKESEYKYEIPKYEYGGGSNTNKSSGGSKSETDEYLENFEKMQDKLKDLYDQGKITTKQYYDALRALAEKYLKDREKYADKLAEIEQEYAKGMKELYDTVISGIISKIDKRISALNDQKDAAVSALEAEEKAAKKVLEAQKEALQVEIDAIDKQISAKQELIDSINDEADAKQRAYDLDKAQYELDRLRNQKTIYEYSGKEKGFIYKTDDKAIRDQEQEVDDKKREIRIANIEKEISALEKRKSALEEQQNAIDDQIDAISDYYEELIANTEAYWDEIIKGMEETKTKWEELQELQENVELEMNLRSLGYEGGIDEVLALTDEQFAEFKNKYLQYIAGMNQGNQSFIDSLSQISGVDIGNLPDIFKETQEYIDMLGQGIDFTALDSSLGGVIDGFTEIANNAKLATGAVIGGTATTSANSSGNKNGAQGENGQNSSGSGDSLNGGIKTMSEESVPKINEVANAFAGSEEGEDTGTSVAGSAQKASKAISSGKDSGGEEDESLQGAIKTQVEAAVDPDKGLPAEKQAWSELDSVIASIAENLAKINSEIDKLANKKVGNIFSGLGISIGGGAHVDGTAFASGTLGKVSDNGVALGGELGREMVVRDGRFFTVGDNGAELFHHKKGDIIFNHKQTQDILKNGHTNSRGKAFAGGNVNSLPKEYSLPSQEVMDRMAKLEAGFNSLNRDESLLVQMQIRDNTKKIYEQNARAIQEVQKYNKSNSTSNTYNYSIDAIELPNVMNGEDFYRDIRRLNTLIKQQSNTRK
jgi:hypothetical protein